MGARGRHRPSPVRRFRRLLALRAATPRHAAPPAASVALVTVRTPAPHARLWPWALAVVAVLMLVVVTPLAFREPGAPRATVPLPTISLPALPTGADPAPAPTRRPLRAARQAAKPGAPSSAAASSAAAPSATVAPVLLGPATNAGLLPLLNSYCRATYGRFTRATTAAGGWFCSTFGRGAVALDMGAMCRWSYGDGARAVLGSPTDPQSWRCVR